jgi:phosphate transport system protein
MDEMTHLETELKLLKVDIIEMWDMVINQISKSKDALANFDKDLARDIKLTEKRIDSYELKIDRDCENVLALYAPVAIDLRFVLAILKINYNLERIGDYANGIAKIIENLDKPFKTEHFKQTQVLEMFDISISIMTDALNAFEKDDTKLGRSVFKKDRDLDDINDKAPEAIYELIKKYPDYANHSLGLLSIIRKLERAGDHTQNIAEEFIFFIEAKVLKHRSKKKTERKKDI